MSIFTGDLRLGGQQLGGKVLGGGQESQGVLPLPGVASRGPALPPRPAQQRPGEQNFYCVPCHLLGTTSIMFKGFF